MSEKECPYCKEWMVQRQTCPLCNPKGLPADEDLHKVLEHMQKDNLTQKEFEELINDINGKLRKLLNLDFERERSELQKLSKPELIEKVIKLLKKRELCCDTDDEDLDWLGGE